MSDTGEVELESAAITTGKGVSEGEDDEVIAAAEALMQLREEAQDVTRRLVNRHQGQYGQAVMTVIEQASQHPLDQPKSAEEIARDELDRMKMREMDAALALIQLSGQSTTESVAALTLLKLKRESELTLHQEQIRLSQERARQAPEEQTRPAAEQEEQTRLTQEEQSRLAPEEQTRLAQSALQEKEVTDQTLALEKFRQQYPAVLRTSTMSGRTTKDQPSSSLLGVVTDDEE